MTQSTINWERCRARIEHEDGLLNERTNIFLVVNGVAAAAATFARSDATSVVIGAVSILANLLWLCTGVQTAFVIRALTTRYIGDAVDPIDEIVRASLRHWPRTFRSTFIVGIYTPILLTVGWIVGFAVLAIT